MVKIMRYRLHAIATLIVMLGLSTPGRVQAQVTGADVGAGWSYQLVPYIWLPWIDTTAKNPVPGGGTATTTVSAGPGNYIPKINLGFMGAGEVRYDRFSVLTDIIYLNTTTTSSRLKSVDFAGSSIPVSGFLATSTNTRVQSTVWTLAGGYTVAHGDWGNVDAIGGFRLLAISQRTKLQPVGGGNRAGWNHRAGSLRWTVGQSRHLERYCWCARSGVRRGKQFPVWRQILRAILFRCWDGRFERDVAGFCRHWLSNKALRDIGGLQVSLVRERQQGRDAPCAWRAYHYGKLKF